MIWTMGVATMASIRHVALAQHKRGQGKVAFLTLSGHVAARETDLPCWRIGNPFFYLLYNIDTLGIRSMPACYFNPFQPSLQEATFSVLLVIKHLSVVIWLSHVLPF